MKKLIAFSCVAALYGAATAFAEPIAVNNHSFEDAGLASGAWSNCIDVICGEADPEYWINPVPGHSSSRTRILHFPKSSMDLRGRWHNIMSASTRM